MKSFFNTINLSGDNLEKAKARALAQEALVEEIFKANPGRHFSPSQLQKLVASKYDRHCPLTSWRRAITNLTKRGVLFKTDKQIAGIYGEPEYCWCYSGNSGSATQAGGLVFKQTELFNS